MLFIQLILLDIEDKIYLEYVEYCQDLEKIENAMVATFVGACIRCTLGIQSGWHQPKYIG